MATLGGPSPISKPNRQVAVPKPILDALGLDVDGDEDQRMVIFYVNPSDPEVALMIPQRVFVRRYERGATDENQER